VKTNYHFCQSIKGALKNWSKEEWEEVGKRNKMTAEAAKEKFRIWDFEGKKVIPIGDPCEGFSYQDGCPGHEVKE